MGVRSARYGIDERWTIREFLTNPASIGSIVARRWPDPVTESLRRNIPLSENDPWQKRVHAFAFVFSAKRLLAAVTRKKTVRSIP